MAKGKRKTVETTKKWPPYTRWYDKLPRSKEDARLREQCRELGIKNIIWG
jgi:hypothetical protein